MLRKSRGGCSVCKSRRVKCDEKKPACSGCSNRGWTCPGYHRPLRWSSKHQQDSYLAMPHSRTRSPQAMTITAQRQTHHESILGGHTRRGTLQDASPDDLVQIANEEEGLESLESESPSSTPSNALLLQSSKHRPTLVFQDDLLLVNCYSDRLARILSIYNGSFNPFRAAALSAWTRSSLLISLFKFLAGAYELSLTGGSGLDIVVNEARISTLNQISLILSEIDSVHSMKKIELLLGIVMFGLSSSWYDLEDLGLAHYNAAAALLRSVDIEEIMPTQNYQYFEECLVYWWMMLSFACDPSQQVIQDPPRLTPMSATKRRIPHPLTGVSSEVQYLLGKVGYLVLGERRKYLDRPLTTIKTVLESLSNIESARGLESQLHTLDLPSAESVVDPKDPYTPVADLINIANAYRVCGLLLLYHAFPDLLRTKLAHGSNDETCGPRSESMEDHLVSLALHALHILAKNSELSGTRTIEAIILVIISGELGSVPRVDAARQTLNPQVELEDTSGNVPGRNLTGMDATRRQESLQQARAAVLARFERVQSVLPFQTIDRMRMLVLKTWDLMDQGKDIFWVDVMIESKWQFLMI
ncbi:fungal-specific transcription factor domain-containing protein [Exophiala viscosa]|uniref:Fungal-specific transcription factor domain-containing protein n=1 Tax=Exophiala viscosa TaxID=2486360 RepID=A0AAN6E365_9EURO|nr:fungal-specific transcription factor domain-containing protein [Exophiala viscosa]KAI1629397.1 fungal-specific transcription factor domain-containing protein [Exophiala viscosa]